MKVLVTDRWIVITHVQEHRFVDLLLTGSKPLSGGLAGGPALLFTLLEGLSRNHYEARRDLSRCQTSVTRALFESLAGPAPSNDRPTLQASLAHIGKQAQEFRGSLDAYKPSGANKQTIWWDSADKRYHDRSEQLVEKVWGVRGDLVRFREAESADMQLLATAGVQDLLRKARGVQTAGVVFAVLTALVAGVALFGTLAAIPANDAALRPLVKGAAAAGLVIMTGVGIGVGLKALSDLNDECLRSLRAMGKWMRWLLAGLSFVLFLLAFLVRDVWGLSDEAMLYVAVGSGVIASGFHVWYERFD